MSLKNSELELAALYRILGGLCDAVVMLDDSLQLTEALGRIGFKSTFDIIPLVKHLFPWVCSFGSS